MPDQLVGRKVRKGTKSCTECRRRKVACFRSSGHASVCRRCEERGSECIAQVFASPSTTKRRATTRDRLERLEQHLAGLPKTACSAGSESGLTDTSPHASATVTQDSQSEFGPDSDDCSGPELPIIEPPAYLNSLFNNDLLCSDNNNDSSPSGGRRDRARKALARLQASARSTLRPLVPSKEDISVFSSHKLSWMMLLQNIFPLDAVSKCGDSILSQYEDMRQPEVDPNSLASWLLLVAITIEQVPERIISPRFKSRWPSASRFSDAVVEAVERTIMAREELSCIIQGVETMILLIRLHFVRGHFRKAWLQLRRVLASAELLGLHRSAEPHAASLWESLCSMDKMSSMMFALPSATRYRQAKTETISSSPYVSQLTSIAVELEDIHDLTDIQLYEKVSKLDSDLRRLATTSPEIWEQQDAGIISLLMRQIYSYVCMRVHLPVILRPASRENSQSRAACAGACLELTRRYTTLSQILPVGFPRQPLDLQALTATVILLLLGFSSSPDSSQTAKVTAEEVCEAMQSITNRPRSDYAKQAIPTIRALVRLLDTDNDASSTMRIPLLGKVAVRRVKPAKGSTNVCAPVTEPLPCVPDPAWGSLFWSVEDSEQIYFEAIMDDCGFGNSGFDFC